MSASAPLPPQTTSTSKTKGVLSLVFGIVSILFSWILPIIWIVLAILAVVLGFISRRSEPGASKLATAGIVLGFIGIACNVASMVLGAILVTQMMQQ